MEGSAMEWPERRLLERGQYVLDRRVLRVNVARDLLALAAMLALGVTLFEAALIYVVDEACRTAERGARIRRARGRPRGEVTRIFRRGGSGSVDHDDPRELARAFLALAGFAVVLTGGLLLAFVGAERGTGGIDLLLTALLSLVYTVPFIVHEHLRWSRAKRDVAVPHLMARDLSYLGLFATLFVLVAWGALAAVVAFVVLRAARDAAAIVPSYSWDGVEWSAEPPG